MRVCLDKRSANLITSHLVAATVQFETIVAGVQQLDCVLLLSNQEADGVERHLKLWADTDERCIDLSLQIRYILLVRWCCHQSTHT